LIGATSVQALNPQINDWREGKQRAAAAATVIGDRRWLRRARTMTAKSISKKGEMKMDAPFYVFVSDINFMSVILGWDYIQEISVPDSFSSRIHD
jgi:hypothetical protein